MPVCDPVRLSCIRESTDFLLMPVWSVGVLVARDEPPCDGSTFVPMVCCDGAGTDLSVAALSWPAARLLLVPRRLKSERLSVPVSAGAPVVLSVPGGAAALD